MKQAPVLGPHALAQMATRGITAADVSAVLYAPLLRELTYQQREAIYGQAVDGRTLKVVIVAGSQPPHVITVYRFGARRLERLLRRGL